MKLKNCKGNNMFRMNDVKQKVFQEVKHGVNHVKAILL